MKAVLTLSLALLSMLAWSKPRSVEIKPYKTIELTQQELGGFNVKITNGSKYQVDVSVNTINDGDWVKGFGLAGQSNAELSIAEGQLLKLKNTSDQTITVKLDMVKRREPAANRNVSSVTFTMRNSSAKSIPLIIPSVMNPNLSPFSNSGVNLKMGQKVLFKYKGKKRVLMVVDDTIKNGDKVDIAKLLKARIEELEQKDK